MSVLSGWARRVRTSRRVGKCYHVKPRTRSVETKLVIRSPHPVETGKGQGCGFARPALLRWSGWLLVSLWPSDVAVM